MGRGLLIIMSGLLIVYGIIQHSITGRQDILLNRTVDYHEEEQARNLAGGLAEYAVKEIQEDNFWTPPDSISNLGAGKGKIQIYNNQASLPSGNSVTNWDQFSLLILAEAEYNGIKAETEVLIQRDSFSRYSYFSHRELTVGGATIYWYGGDVVSGPVHTNGTFTMAGSPTFNGAVTSPNNWVGRSGTTGNPQGTDTPQFNDETNFTADEITPPTDYELDPLRNAAQSGGLAFNDPIQVEFNDNGTVDIATGEINCSWWGCNTSWDSPTNYDMDSFNGVISSTDEIHTKGTLKGQATLYSEKQVEIIGDLRYNTDPRVDSTSTDLLGIVSGGSVLVEDNAHRDNGSRDIDIHASIMALDKSFTVEGWSSGGYRGSINLLGGIVQIERGPVGTFTTDRNGNQQPSTGFDKAYTYDTRLLRSNPPEYPRQRRFSIQYWKDRPLTMAEN